MSFLSVVFILTFLSSTKCYNQHQNHSKHNLSWHSVDLHNSFYYPRKSLKCYACLNDIRGARENCGRRGKFITCKYSTRLINWYDVSHKPSTKYGCIFLVYKENNDVMVKRGCVALPNEDYSVCAGLEHVFKLQEILQCFVCQTDRCNASKSNLERVIFTPLIPLCLILLNIL